MNSILSYMVTVPLHFGSANQLSSQLLPTYVRTHDSHVHNVCLCQCVFAARVSVVMDRCMLHPVYTAASRNACVVKHAQGVC